jgi:hypothetical protein
MKYSLRSLMIVVIVGPPLLALAIVFTPLILERLFPPTPAPPPAAAAPKLVKLSTLNLKFKLKPVPKDRVGDFNTPPPALGKSLEMDRSPAFRTIPESFPSREP